MAILRLDQKKYSHVEMIHALVNFSPKPGDLEISLRFGDQSFLSLSALALLCLWGLQRRHQGWVFKLLEKGNFSYPARMDLCHHLGIELDQALPRHDEDGRFITLTLIENRQASAAAAEEKLCNLIRQQLPHSQDLLPAFRWVVQELIDNIGNHAQSSVPGVVCAQYYPKSGTVNLVVCDLGCGIKAGLTPYYPGIYSHGDAISKILEAGFTRDPGNGSGRGLTGSRQIVRANGGSFDLWSGDVTWSFNPKGKPGPAHGGTFRKMDLIGGTGLSITLKTGNPVDLRQINMAGDSHKSSNRAARELELLLKSSADRSGSFSIRLADEGLNLGDRDAGLALRQRVLTLLHQTGGPAAIALDFAGAQQPSSSFLDAAIGRLYDDLGGQDFPRKIFLDGQGPLALSLTAGVLASRLTGPLKQLRKLEPIAQRLGLIFKPERIFLWPDIGRQGLERWLGRIWPDAGMVELQQELTLAAMARAMDQILAQNLPTLVVPPWRRLTYAEGKDLEAFSGASASDALLWYFVAHLPQTPPCAFLVQPGLLAGSMVGGKRAELQKRDLIRCLLEASAEQLQISGLPRDFALALVQLGQRRPKEEAFRIAMLSADLLSLDERLFNARDLNHLLSPFGRDNKLGYSFCWSQAQEPLSFQSQHPDMRRSWEELEQKGGLVELAALIQSHSQGLAGAESLASSQTGTPLIRPADLEFLGHMRLSDLGCFVPTAELDPQQQVAAGDLLIQKKVGRESPLYAVVVPPALEGAYVSQLLHLRPKPGVNSLLLAGFLNTHYVTGRIKGRLRGTLVSWELLSRIPVPSQNHKLTRLVSQLEQTRAQLQRSLDGYDQTLRALLTEPNLLKQIREVAPIAVNAGLLQNMVGSMEDLEVQLRMTLPLPLAMGLRSLAIAGEPGLRYKLILDLFEAVIQYLGCMTLVALRGRVAATNLLQSFAPGSHGVTLGNWAHILTNCPQIKPQELKQARFPELLLLLSQRRDNSFEQISTTFIGWRNDNSHGRGPSTPGGFRQAVQQAEPKLMELLGMLRFLSLYPLIQVKSSNIREEGGQNRVRYLKLMGDNPQILAEEKEMDPLVVDGLYLLDEWQKPLKISPLLEAGECPKCNQLEVCHPDRWLADLNGLEYRGMAFGHKNHSWPGNLERLRDFLKPESSG